MLSSVSSFLNSLVTSNRHADSSSNSSSSASAAAAAASARENRRSRALEESHYSIDNNSPYYNNHYRSSGDISTRSNHSFAATKHTTSGTARHSDSFVKEKTKKTPIPTTRRPPPLALAHDGSPTTSISNLRIGSPSSIVSTPSTTTAASGAPPTIGYYSPGARTSFTASRSSIAVNNTIQLQDFAADGVPLPPTPAASWARIDEWAEEHYPELYDQLASAATRSDVDELEAELGCLDVGGLPMDVRESLYVHDGQERGGSPTGIIFGVTLLDCEEIVEEWKIWKKVASRIDDSGSANTATPVASSSRMSKRATARDQSRPAGAVLPVYAHAKWIPLAKDYGGNNIAVDLSPGPTGTFGQVILFGHSLDTKYVVARSWTHFLAIVASDFNRRQGWTINEETGELCIGSGDKSYFDALKERVDLYLSRRNSSAIDSRRSSLADLPTGSLPGSSRRSSAVSTGGGRYVSPLMQSSATFSGVVLPRAAAVRSSSYMNSPNASTVSLPEGTMGSPSRTVSSSSTTRLLSSSSMSTLVPIQQEEEIKTSSPVMEESPEREKDDEDEDEEEDIVISTSVI